MASVLAIALWGAFTLPACPADDFREETPAFAPALELYPLDGDVWAFELEAGLVVDPGDGAPCARVELEGSTGRVEAAFILDAFVAAVPLVAGDNTVIARCIAEDGRVAESAPRTWRVRLAAPPTAPPLDVELGVPEWVDGSVLYAAVPVLFGYDGIASITERLDDLAALGVDVVWVSPIHQVTFGDFGFDVTDHFAVNPELGTLEDFRVLVDEAHARGLRVILDLVPNHTSNQHPYFLDAQEHGEGSRYWSFHERDDEGEPSYYFDWEHLPNLDFDNAEVRRMVIESLAHWVREVDVDGFRVDVAWGVLDRDPTFWPQARAELRALKPDLFLLAEASARDDRIFPVFDAGYDWTNDLGVWAWQEAFDAGPPYALLLREAVGAVAARRTVHFLDNNDTGTRFRDEHGDDVTRAARALTMFLPGLPLVYSGDEIGASYEPYEQYDPLPWESGDPALHAELANLIALRRLHPAFKTVGADAFALVPTDHDDDVLAFTRGLDGERVLVLVSFASSATTVTATVDGVALTVDVPAFDAIITPL